MDGSAVRAAGGDDDSRPGELGAAGTYLSESNAEDTRERVQYMGRLLRQGHELYCNPAPDVALMVSALPAKAPLVLGRRGEPWAIA